VRIGPLGHRQITGSVTFPPTASRALARLEGQSYDQQCLSHARLPRPISGRGLIRQQRWSRRPSYLGIAKVSTWKTDGTSETVLAISAMTLFN